MFKRLKDLLFNEEEYVEEEEVEISHVKIPDPITKSPQTTTPTITKVVPVEKKKTETVEVISQTKSSTLKPLTVDAEEVHPSKAHLNSEPQREYEFSPVISPFFGVRGEAPVRAPLRKNDKKENKNSDLDTIISPFYGRINDNHDEQSSPITIEPSSNINESLTLEEILSQSDNDSEAVQVSLFDSNED